MRIRDVKFQRCQLGWLCKIGFTFASTRQFTDEYHLVECARKWWIVAFFAARWQAKFHVSVHGAKPGERKALGWGG